MTFEPFDLIRLLTLTFLEILLSADNAAILALLCHRLSPELRKKALFIGVASAFVFRGVALIGISFLLRYRWIHLLGAAYLLYISIRYFVHHKKRKFTPSSQSSSFWKTVFLIEFFDFAFAIDSIIAGLAFIANIPIPDGHELNPKLWIVYAGGILGLLGIRYSASVLTSLLDRFPRLEASAHIMIGIIGLKLIFPSFAPIFWIALALAFISGFYRKSSS